MPMQGQYPLGNRQLANTDTVTAVVSGTTADIPLANLAQFVTGSNSSGPTSSRPSPASIGQFYFDTTLGQPIWSIAISPAAWVNAAGVIV